MPDSKPQVKIRIHRRARPVVDSLRPVDRRAIVAYLRPLRTSGAASLAALPGARLLPSTPPCYLVPVGDWRLFLEPMADGSIRFLDLAHIESLKQFSEPSNGTGGEGGGK